MASLGVEQSAIRETCRQWRLVLVIVEGKHMAVLMVWHVMSSLRSPFYRPSEDSKRLHRRRHRIGVEDRIDPLYHVTGDFQEAPLVLQGNQRPACAVVHADMERLGEGFHRLDVPLDAQVSQVHQT